MDPITFEPKLNEVLDDPIVQAVMACDGLDRYAVLRIIETARERLQQALEPAA